MTRNGKRRWWLWTSSAGVAAIVMLAGYAAVAKVESQPAGAAGLGNAPSVSIPVVAAHVRVGDMGVYLTGLGTVTALKTASVLLIKALGGGWTTAELRPVPP